VKAASFFYGYHSKKQAYLGFRNNIFEYPLNPIYFLTAVLSISIGLVHIFLHIAKKFIYRLMKRKITEYNNVAFDQLDL
jgi:hypothetical protein